MSKKWFILNPEKQIVNIIAADTKTIAEAVTGLTAIEVTESLGGGIGDTWIEEYGKFKPEFKPYASWEFDYDLWRYEAPVPQPVDDKTYAWNEDSLSWIEIVETPPTEGPAII